MCVFDDDWRIRERKEKDANIDHTSCCRRSLLPERQKRQKEQEKREKTKDGETDGRRDKEVDSVVW